MRLLGLAVLSVLLVGCATTRSRALPLGVYEARRTLAPLVANAQRMGLEARVAGPAAVVLVHPPTATEVSYELSPTSFRLVIRVPEGRVASDELDKHFQWPPTKPTRCS